MKLREITVNICYEPHIYGIIESGCESREEYLKRCQEYYKENIFELERTLSLQTKNITSFFSRLYYKSFKDMQFPFNKIIISCCRDKENSGRIKVFEGIAEVEVLYNYSVFPEKSNEQKKRDTLDIIMNALNIICENYKEDISPFEQIKSMIIAKNYKNKWVWKTKLDPSRKFKAAVEIEHEADIFLRIEDKNGNTVFNKKLVSAKPDEWDYAVFSENCNGKAQKVFCFWIRIIA